MKKLLVFATIAISLSASGNVYLAQPAEAGMHNLMLMTGGQKPIVIRPKL